MKTLKDNRIKMLVSNNIPTLRTEAINPDRDGMGKLYYSKRWREKTRPAALGIMPMCCRCRRARSQVVDHVQPRLDASDLEADHNMRNLQATCHACHHLKQTELGDEGNRRGDANHLRALASRDWRTDAERESCHMWQQVIEDGMNDIGC